ncbi:unnamed protein product [Bursaphelenchus xylophilus]|uniref:3-hydroxyacyl-CoA dehydrogenase type-2 n=1 Tax=Bursaphelenchus xylophilus TaxID=6326 RepID=A0A1I7S3X1_BURXY|nr:unnamed protein product [Bursaphelenchus xylophilus]CAG9116542.1 unnamed protein product [Bursaphelenchus xylophilus]
MAVRPIKDLVALVTGGSSGLGRATVEYLHRNGARVALLDLDKTDGKDVVSGLKENAIFTPADVRKEDDVAKAFEQVKNTFGRLDAIVNCAGIAYAFRTYNTGKREKGPLERYQHTLDVNVIGTINVIRHGVHLMMDNKLNDPADPRGVIVNTASVAAFDGQIGQVAYSASKGAITSMTLPLARELGPSGIRVCTIAPGVFSTPLLEKLPSKVKKYLASLVPYPARLGDTTEFARLVETIIQNEYLNGETIRLDGALRMPP